MIEGIIIILIAGFVAGVIANRLHLPRLLGMLLVGVLLGPYVLNVLDTGILAVSNEIRLFALVVILLKAGLGLDRDKLAAHGTVALRLGFLPCALEATAVAIGARYFLGWGWLPAWVLGWVLCAESPAVLVPLMLKLKGKGLGAKQGIPDLILAGGTLSDVVAITVFGIVLQVAVAEVGVGWGAVLAIPVQVFGGLFMGYVLGKAIAAVLGRARITENPVQDLIVTLVATMAVVLLGEQLNYSGYLAVMTGGFVLLTSNEVLARRIRSELDRVWIVAEIFLFVLIGAAVNISVVAAAGLAGLLILFFGLAVGRLPGILLSTWGSDLRARERLFMSASYVPKATVQAAIGALPLAMGVPYGEVILAFAVLAIVVTAPLGAVLIGWLAPKLLEKGVVDPTKVSVKEAFRFLVALDRKEGSLKALEQAAKVARQVDGKLIILHVDRNGRDSKADLEQILAEGAPISDIEHEYVVSGGNPAEIILEEANHHQAHFIFMGKANRVGGLPGVLVGDVTRQVVSESRVPVIVVE